MVAAVGGAGADLGTNVGGAMGGASRGAQSAVCWRCLPPAPATGAIAQSSRYHIGLQKGPPFARTGHKW